MKKSTKITLRILSCMVVACLSLGVMFGNISSNALPSIGEEITSSIDKTITRLDNLIDMDIEQYYDENVVFKLPETVSKDEEISVIVEMSNKPLFEEYKQTAYKTVGDYVQSSEGMEKAEAIKNDTDKLVKKLTKAGINFTVGEKYNTLLSGFEIIIKASQFSNVNKILGDDVTLILSDTYEKCQTEVVENYVEVYETGIFDSSAVEFQGDGVVVAVLDTGLDYTHTAFSPDRFSTEIEAFTRESVAEKVSKTKAAEFTSGLTGEDVYINKKVPFAYDYADKDPDVLPINSEHGTHVAGIIAGHDDTITGVAPNAQLAIFKVFSDTQTGAKDSWILAALEDCVTLGVDVINMSLGTSCGFTREVDEENKNEIYDRINEAGISLVTAASNDGVATSGSKKNGSNPLTKNPDYGTVGAPSTYESALSVASVDGVKTPYMLYGNEIIYFTEASAYGNEHKSFVDDILKTVGNVDTYDFDYVTIPGVGRPSDYPADNSYYAGKIVLVKRGETTFEDKVRVGLKEKGAAGVIIYNNISGTISMSVGADIGACCSLAQDEGELLAAAGEGKIRISRSQLAGPFMSDFSSWGPTSDLKIKPEITAHGGEILSAVPGQDYDRLSGTSMAAPNQAGATALIRQYVKYNENIFGELTSSQINARVYQLMMSSADIVLNKNGLPFAVRKQGAGLVNIKKALTTASYITTYDKDGNVMDKTKFELGDDKEKKGEYELVFDINNISTNNVTYDVSAVALSEGVSKTYTSHSDTTVSLEGYLLDGAKTSVVSVEGGNQNGNQVTVNARSSAKVTVKIKLSDKDKEYIDKNFENGMYVEGFLKLKATDGTTVDMSAPFLSFYGTWNQAPIFDEEYYDTNKDEFNNGLNDEDKLMEDAFASVAVGGLYNDYIAYLGSFYFVQDENSNRVAANKEYISLSNQYNGESSTLNSLKNIYAGLLRNAKEVNISIVDSVTGEEIFNHSEFNVMKSRSYGSNMSPAFVDVDFNVPEYNLKNNTKYNVTVTAYTDYEDHETQNKYNKRNVFKFPLYIDFEAPIVTGVNFRTETEKDSAGQTKTKYFADINIYDNHYTMAASIGSMGLRYNEEEGRELFYVSNFNKYMIPVVSAPNSTSTITYELTDYISDIRNSCGMKVNEDGTTERLYNTNTFIVGCYDYAMNSAMYEIKLPDEFVEMSFTQDEIKLSPNETVDLSTLIQATPDSSWITTLDITSSDTDVCDIVDQKLLAKSSGAAIVTAIGKDKNGNTVQAELKVTVLSEGDDGYVGDYTLPTITNFELTGYRTDFAFYERSSEDRDIGLTGSTNIIGKDPIEMFPDEKITILYKLSTYFPENMKIVCTAGNRRAEVKEIVNKDTGASEWQVRALEEGSSRVTVSVENTETGKTEMSKSIYLSVKDPYTVNAIYLMSYKGLGGEVVIPTDLGFTTIYEYAFSNSENVPKDTSKGDVIDDEDPYYTKATFIGNDTITKVVIPEGVVEIQNYAFAGLTALEEVVLPSTLKKIGGGAFQGCTKLRQINLESVKFINQYAFYNTALTNIDLSSSVAIGNYAFANAKLSYLELPTSAQSIGIGSFENNAELIGVTFNAPKVKLGVEAFAGCEKLTDINVNAAVIPSYAFADCAGLTNVTLGADVSVIGEFAFAGTKVSKFTLDNNEHFITKQDGALLYRKPNNGSDKATELVLCAPNYGGTANTVTLDDDTTTIGVGAFAGNRLIFTVVANNVTEVGEYAFESCSNLDVVTMPKLQLIGNFAFALSNIQNTPSLDIVTRIGDRAFYGTPITSVTISDGTEIGEYAFALCINLTDVIMGNNVKVGEAAFYNPVANHVINPSTMTQEQVAQALAQYYTRYDYNVYDAEGNVVATYDYYKYNFAAGAYSSLKTLTLGNNVEIGDFAFSGNAKLTQVELGENTVIGAQAFYNCASLTSLDFTNVTSIGDFAFSGLYDRDYAMRNNVLVYGFELVYVEGEEIPVSFRLTSFAPSFETIDLSKVTTLGEGAFANNRSLKNVTLNAELKAIPAGLFMNCNMLTTVELPQTVTEIGLRAFYGAGLETIDLSNVSSFGEDAFGVNNLTSVTIAPNAKVGAGAFADNLYLEAVENLETATEIGEYAFSNTALTAVTLNATEIGDFAFANALITEVTLGSNVTKLGENPFANCPLVTFAKTTDNKADGTVSLEDTFDVSETVSVINGVLYEKLKSNGLELVSYPMMSEETQYIVADNTVRLSAMAFAGSNLSLVKLPLSLLTIGDKAFFGAENLDMVVFQSYTAPSLEEEYDETYADLENMASGSENMFAGMGLGITDYYMWNFTDPTNFYYGANFVNYVGKIENKLIMVKPSNGNGYNSFILGQYFGTTLEGAVAPLVSTLEVIELIDKIPADLDYKKHKQLVEDVRKAYDNLASLEQQALVHNYAKLVNAENIIVYLTPAPTEVITLIDALPEASKVTLETEAKVKEAREAYDKLSDADKQKCTNYNKLVEAESVLSYLKAHSGDSSKPTTQGGSLFVTILGYILAVLAIGAFVAYVVVEKKKKAGNGTDETNEANETNE